MLKLFDRPKAKDPLAPEPITTDDIRDDAEYIQHAALARKLGVAIAAPSISTSKVLRVALSAECLPVYNLRAVEKYMDDLSVKRRTMWHWYPLRNADREHVTRDEQDREREGGFTSYSGRVTRDRYSQAVPLPVLMTVDRLLERLGHSVSFFVAALGVGDPFLAVRLNSAPDQMFVIERWDEPGFRDTKKVK